MPSNFFTAEAGFPSFTNEQTTKERLEIVMNYLYMLLEQLRYTLGNLEVSNFNDSALEDLQTIITKPVLLQIANDEETILALTTVAEGLSLRVTNVEGQYTSLVQTVNSISLSVTSGGSIALYRDGVQVSGGTIDLNGYVTFTNLSTSGSTTINADNITTGTLNATQVTVSDCFAVEHGGTAYGYVGCAEGNDGSNTTYGAMLTGPDRSCYVIATNSGVRMTAGNEAIWVASTGPRSTSAISVVSDAREKKEIDYDLAQYRELFQRLRPCSFRMKDGDGARHLGFLAQDVERALHESGMTAADFAGLDYDKANDRYMLRYGEFIALQADMIRQLAFRVAALEKNLEKERGL